MTTVAGPRDQDRKVEVRLVLHMLHESDISSVDINGDLGKRIPLGEALRGTCMVLIGGKPRPHGKAALEREFELAELDWQVSEEHSSIASFESAIAKERTRVVAIMIRWSSHSYEGVQEMCRKHGKIFVRLPGGYNPVQVAHQVVEQASAQLGLMIA